MNLSPSQQRVLECFYKHENRVYSWQLCQEAFTSDYRRRIHELRKMGYRIEKFSERYSPVGRINFEAITRHGYILIPPSTKEKKR